MSTMFTEYLQTLHNSAVSLLHDEFYKEPGGVIAPTLPLAADARGAGLEFKASSPIGTSWKCEKWANKKHGLGIYLSLRRCKQVTRIELRVERLCLRSGFREEPGFEELTMQLAQGLEPPGKSPT